MFDILRFMYPNVSVEYLIEVSNFFIIAGSIFIFLGVLGLILESIGQKRLFYEAFQLILLGLFLMKTFGMHSNFSVPRFFSFGIQFLIPI